MNFLPFMVKQVRISLLSLVAIYPWHAVSCPVLDSSGDQVKGLSDALFSLLQTSDPCPKDVIEFRALLAAEGAKFATTMVANRGYHNPSQGSFSFFEMVTIEVPLHLAHPVEKDELFFGHFTAAASGNTLVLDQEPLTPSLMIELISWDPKNEVYNFYELLGSEQGPHWFYRGSSVDIWTDTAKLHRTRAQGEPVFGNKLRCSGCHVAGGPIMKEISEPHDSWWRAERPLPLGGRKPDADMQHVMQGLQSPESLRDVAVSGLAKLMSGKAFKAKQAGSLQVALRPLFCPEEINLEATPWPLDTNVDEVSAPSGFLLDERLDGYAVTRAPKSFYVKALQLLNSKFPETSRIDGDHAWNTPVKATSDKMAIANLVAEGLIDQEFVADVLAIDMTRPMFSQKRCGLLQSLPATWNQNWQGNFEANLKQSSLPEAHELLDNLTLPDRDSKFHKDRAQHFIEKCQAALKTEAGVQSLVSYLGQVRAEVSASEISQNRRGQILEPGFRVIFPDFKPSPKPWEKSLDLECELK